MVTKIFILYILTADAGIHSQEFTSKFNCEKAKSEIVDSAKKVYIFDKIYAIGCLEK